MSRRLIIIVAALLAAAVTLGVYVLHLKRRATRDAQLAADQQTTLAPVGPGAPVAVTLYVASDNDGTLHKTQVNVSLPAERSERDRAILRTLMAEYLKASSPHPIGTGSEVRQVYLLSEDTAVVDTNSAFADAHPSGVLAEELTIASVVMTLNANDSKIIRVKILVNGRERETLAGHADLRRFYDAGSMGQIVSGLLHPTTPAVAFIGLEALR
jgi:Sporulation and spore germination